MPGVTLILQLLLATAAAYGLALAILPNLGWMFANFGWLAIVAGPTLVT